MPLSKGPINMDHEVVDALISPDGRLDILSRIEVGKLLDTSHGGLYHTLRNCALAVLNCGNEPVDGKELLERNKAFEITLIQRERGIKLDLKAAPASAFVDGRMIKGIHEHLFAVLRDILYVGDTIIGNPQFDLGSSKGVTNAVFHILRNAGVVHSMTAPNLVVCWGGHSISHDEYEYTTAVGYQLGLRGLDICTGCGPGAMKGPMRGAAIAHAMQRIGNGRYLGFTEPGVIAVESPNPIVNDLVIFPDIEKRLEAFVRSGHGIVIFPGGAGTAEEVLYILGILLHPANAAMPFPLILSGPRSASDYLEQIDQFISGTLGERARCLYRIIVADPPRVAQEIEAGIKKVRAFRKENGDAYYFNWLLEIDHEFQRPFHPTHESMRWIALGRDQPDHKLAANLRRAFSGVVSGNVKDHGIRKVEQDGPFEIHGDPELMASMDALLTSFVKQQRMKLRGSDYRPCYRIIK